MKSTILLIVLSVLSMFLSCCNKLFPDEKLTLQRRDYTGNELRTDGYYYYYTKNNSTAIYFLYRNGVILLAGVFSSYNLDNIEKEMIKYYGKYIKTDWGVFVIEGNSIQYEKWVEGLSGLIAAINRCSGYIENDTTIHFAESYYSGRKETKQINEVWHFKQFDNKPDSTNVYIK